MTIKTIADVERANALVGKYKQLDYQVHTLLPRMTAVAVMIPSDSKLNDGTWQAIDFSPELVEAIQREGHKSLVALIDELESMGIDLGLDSVLV